MSNIQSVPALDKRPETGVMKFGDDWPGVFIRGDNAFAYAMAVRFALKQLPDIYMEKSILSGLAKLLEESRVK